MRAPRATPRLRSLAVWLALTVGAIGGACDAIVGAGDRKLDTSIVCDDSGCECATGRGDCDGEPDNGCETDLSDPEHCGACDNVCENGACVDLACTCEGNFLECDGDPATVCETDVATSSEHCGVCGRSCAGEACAEGLCVPQPVGTVDFIYTYILVGSTVYLAAGEPGVHKMSVEGGALQQVGNDNVYANALVAGGTSIYWTSPNDVRSTSTVTGATTVLATPSKTWQNIAIGGGKVYWGEIDGTPANPGTMRLMRTTTAEGGTAEQVAVLGEGKYLHDFVTTTEHVYWNDITQLRRTSHEALSPQTFLEAPSPPTFMTLIPEALAFAGITSSTYLATLEDASVEQLASLPGYGPLTGDATNVYFVTFQDGSPEATLWRVPRAGGEPFKLATDEAPPIGAPYMATVKLAVDDTWVYWVGGASANLFRVAK